MKDFIFLGVDETSLGLQNNGLIVAVAESYNPSTIQYQNHGSLKKARNYLQDAEAFLKNSNFYIDYDKIPTLPSYDSLVDKGLSDFYWGRFTSGRFPRQLLEHMSIAHLISRKIYDPQSTVVLIDSFHCKRSMSRHLLYESFQSLDFKIPFENIELCDSGDISVPLINFADLLAFQVGLAMNDKYKKYNSNPLFLPLDSMLVDWSEKRVKEPITNGERDLLEDMIAAW